VAMIIDPTRLDVPKRSRIKPGTTKYTAIYILLGLYTLFSLCMAAYPIARIKFRLSQPLLYFFLLGIMIPYMLTAIPLYTRIMSLRQDFDIDSRVILIVLYAVSGFSFNTYIMTGFYKALPYEMEEAAALDGASPFRTFWQIMLPLVCRCWSSSRCCNDRSCVG